MSAARSRVPRSAARPAARFGRRARRGRRRASPAPRSTSNSPTRGIAVTVNKDDGQQVTIAQRDDGDVQMGDRVIIVYDNEGVARAVRDTGRRRD